MRAFLTGGNGFIGSVVARKLVEQDYALRCLLRPTSNTARLDGIAFERVVGDVRDPATLESAVRGCDAVVHLAGLSAWSDIHSPLLHPVVVDGTQNLLAAVRSAGGPRTVVVSSCVAVNGTLEPSLQTENSTFLLPRRGYAYAHAKFAAESLARAAAAEGVPVVIVNPGEVYGPRDTGMVTAGNLVDFARSSPVLVCTGGTSVVYVDDVADGILAALQHGRAGQRYILGGDNLTIYQLARLTLELLGQTNKRVLLLPNQVVTWIATIGSAFRIPLPFNPAVVPYATRFWFMDNMRARTELGLSFRSARDALLPTLAWLQNAGYIS